MTNQFRIAGLGEVLWDVYADQKYPGGAPANFAAHVAMAGHHGIILSRVGVDALGDELLEELSKFGVDISHVQRDRRRPTGTVTVSLDEKGVPSFICNHNVAFDHMRLTRDWREVAYEIDAVLFGTLAQRNEVSQYAIRTFLEESEQSVKIYDINLRGWDEQTGEILEDSFYRADVIKLNDAELQELREVFPYKGTDIDFLRAIMDEYVIDLSVVTLGPNGCLCVTWDDYLRHPGFIVDVDDTTGAGDAFAAGMAIKYLEGASLIEIAEFGNKLGALVSTKTGAVPFWSEEDLKKINRLRS